MRNIYIIIIFCLGLTSSIDAQINITGDAYYQTDIVGYMGRRSKGCGDIDGLRWIKVFNATEHTLFSGREIFYPFDVNYTSTKNNPVTRMEIKAINRWKNGVGTCDRGPDDVFTRYNDLNYCYSRYIEDPGAGLRELTITNRPVVNLTIPTDPLYLGDLNQLRIALPDHLTPSQYQWKYKVGGGPDQTIPAAYNGRSVLDIQGRNFLTEADFGKNVAVWLEMNCDAGEKLAEGIARRDAFIESNDRSITGCPHIILGGGPCITAYYEARWRELLTPEFIARYQSRRSNPVVFTYLKAAPTIYAVEQTPVSCRNSTDGKVKIIFNTNLESGEKFASISLKKGSDLTTQIDITRLNSEPGGRWSYTFPNNISPGIYEVKLLGSYRGTATYTDGEDHTATIEVRRPSVVQFDITEVINSRCDDNDTNPDNNNDGEILITASGNNNPGVYQYSYQLDGGGFSTWADFNAGAQHRMRFLKPGDYQIKVQKLVRSRSVACIAHVLNAGEPTSVVKVERVTITEPDEPLQIEYALINEPRAFGFEDGRISARIFGGTTFGDGSYRFEWKNEAGDVLTTFSTEVLPADQGYRVILHSIGAGNYFLNAWDANYDAATYRTGCFEVNSEYTLEQPDPLEVNIEIYNPISCHIDNEYSDGIDFNIPLGLPDQFQDGALIATVTGGVPFDKFANSAGECRTSFRRYCYRWKKNVGGVWQDIAVNDSIIRNQSVGTYALNVEDKNGIVLGTYAPVSTPAGQEYQLVTAIDSTTYLSQPDKLGISFTSTVISCANGNDAEATTIVTGGTPPYRYEWSTGETTATIQNLIAGIYLVFVTDAKGCQIEGRVKIEQPNGLEILPVSVVAPTCFEGNDGQIEVNIRGGNPPYRYTWNTGSKSTRIDGLSSGTYRIEVIDTKGCKAFYEVQLTDPDPIRVHLEEKRFLCEDQILALDITIDDPGATYLWSSENGFTSTNSAVEITKTGRYTATITSSLGCIGTGTMDVEVLDLPIDAYFLIATQGYTNQEVIMVNISDPLGDPVEWTIPEEAEVVSETPRELVLKFEKEGTYDVSLRSYQQYCYQDFTETIFVLPAIETPETTSAQGEFIEEFIVFPNPNDGTFKTKISLAEDANITVKIIDLVSGAIIHKRSEKNNRDFVLDYAVAAPTGVYLILLETTKGTAVRKLVFE
ncbi:T9SS type A sorting domain-containing protein [Aquimarina algiphila]|uniref:T9SS type A sorting domain-containing protein n=1 Tax=Aquimarina algiphila TaxID=2047982 RepID=UPI00232DEC49|nr:T9SS type A sorting domain-containing protein [Aquimarina algiphila]